MKNIVIIGGGPAGLTAAYELVKDNNDNQVTILEESAVLGGIMVILPSATALFFIGSMDRNKSICFRNYCIKCLSHMYRKLRKVYHRI